MRIAIDARMINASGIGRYLRNLINELQKLDKKNEYYILLLKDDYYSLNFNQNFYKVLADFKWYTVKEQIFLPQILNKIKPDLVHFPHFNVPIFYGGKFVVTIHDLIHQHHSTRNTSFHDPLTFRIKKLGYTKVFEFALRNSEKIFTPSEFVKKQLINEWRISRSKILVTPEAVDDIFFRSKKNDELLSGVRSPYILYVGNAHPHKNVEGLIKAFLKLKESNLKLVLSGKDNYFWQRIKKEFKNPDIIYTGYIADKELVALYKNAKCFVTASFEEGFGLPVLEAMALGCPVVCSDIGSLREVGGNAALYFNSRDINDMANNISHMLSNFSLRNELIEKGRKRVKLFNFQKMAKQTLEVYQKCV